MRRALWQNIRTVDWALFVPMVILMAVSLIVIYSISVNPVSPEPALFRTQFSYVAIGIVAFFVASSLNYRLWSSYSKIIYVAGALLLVYVLLFGVTIRGTTGWISLGFATFQPVEFAKIGLIVFLAKYFSEHGRLFFMWRHIIISGLATALYMGLVLQQPDLGSGMVLFGAWFLMLMIIGIQRRHLVIMVVAMMVMAVSAWFGILQPYQQDRIVTFLNPQADALGVGYNVRQSIIAVGSGRILGRGFGLGSQSQLRFLPEPETDFIFAVIAEEFGLMGALIVVGSLFFLVYRMSHLAQRTRDNFAAYFLLSLGSLLAVQSFINIGMNIGIAPVTGIPLPLISAGGSSLVSFCIACGIASSIFADQRTLAVKEA